MSKETFPKRRVLVNIELLVFIKEPSISLIMLKRKSLITKQEASKEKMRICFNIKATRSKWIQSILKTMFELTLTQVTWAKA